MIIKINMQSEVPIYLQLRNEIVKGIGREEFEPGESLPTVRQMATDLGINTMTVSKAYQLLKAEGFDAEVVYICTIKPVYEELIVKSAKKTGKVVE